MEEEYLGLPEKLYYEDYGGNFTQFFEDVYAIFKRDFLVSRAHVYGKVIAMKKYPLIAGKEYTFYHITHDGDDEANRIPNLRRMECIPFPRVMIDNISHPYLKVWRNQRKNDNRILIYHEEERYLVVLAVRGEYVLLWTAYLVDHKHQHEKLLREYEAYNKKQESPE